MNKEKTNKEFESYKRGINDFLDFFEKFTMGIAKMTGQNIEPMESSMKMMRNIAKNFIENREKELA
jgi:hypothetical protein